MNKPAEVTEENEIDPNLVEVDGHLLFRCIDVDDWTAELQKAHDERLASFLPDIAPQLISLSAKTKDEN